MHSSFQVHLHRKRYKLLYCQLQCTLLLKYTFTEFGLIFLAIGYNVLFFSSIPSPLTRKNFNTSSYNVLFFSSTPSLFLCLGFRCYNVLFFSNTPSQQYPEKVIADSYNVLFFSSTPSLHMGF